jgi:hypothetical protein
MYLTVLESAWLRFRHAHTRLRNGFLGRVYLMVNHFFSNEHLKRLKKFDIFFGPIATCLCLWQFDGYRCSVFACMRCLASTPPQNPSSGKKNKMEHTVSTTSEIRSKTLRSVRQKFLVIALLARNFVQSCTA